MDEVTDGGTVGNWWLPLAFAATELLAIQEREQRQGQGPQQGTAPAAAPAQKVPYCETQCPLVRMRCTLAARENVHHQTHDVRQRVSRRAAFVVQTSQPEVSVQVWGRML